MSNNLPHENEKFAGYQWSYFSSLSEGPLRTRAHRFFKSTDWTSLIQCASAKRNGLECRLLPDVGLGYNHMVRVVEFADGIRWVARLRMPPAWDGEGTVKTREIIESEFWTICLVRKESKIPVPQVFCLETDSNSRVGAPFMLMDCLRGNVGIDLSMTIPCQHKLDVYTRMAEIHTDLFNIRLPKIGKVIGINEDGTYRQGPLPNLGGPFDTAAEFFRVWSTKVEFGLSKDQLQNAAGPFADEVSYSLSTFKKLVFDNAEWLSVNNTGPFPLCHGDFGHNNMVFDDEYHLLGVIDWETAFAAPCEVSGEFPLSISVIPPAMDVPWKYDEAGYPKEPGDRQRLADREQYIAIVRQQEKEKSLNSGYTLSSALDDSRRQYVVSAMRLYQSGKAGWYSKVMEGFTKDQ